MAMVMGMGMGMDIMILSSTDLDIINKTERKEDLRKYFKVSPLFYYVCYISYQEHMVLYGKRMEDNNALYLIMQMIVLDFFFAITGDGDDDDDDDDSSNSDWLFDLQEPDGEKVNTQKFS